MDRLIKFLADSAQLVEARLGQIMPIASVKPETLHEAMRYSVLGGGKRLRPALTLASYDAACGKPELRNRALDAGCAIELLHAYSLVHDDLPAMDNDTMRRNRLTTHKAFGETIAILAGDALQALAFKTMAACDADKAGEVMFEMAMAAGSTGMVGGQVLDFEGEGKTQDVEEIERIDRWKTGSLFT
ncbi:MAG: polyprenyl synthetase family protein, partial [Planctomycetes bacterium]|nr:polyprenyl synthetase family protein [Planctomycetota bacterium]